MTKIPKFVQHAQKFSILLICFVQKVENYFINLHKYADNFYANRQTQFFYAIYIKLINIFVQNNNPDSKMHKKIIFICAIYLLQCPCKSDIIVSTKSRKGQPK